MAKKKLKAIIIRKRTQNYYRILDHKTLHQTLYQPGLKSVILAVYFRPKQKHGGTLVCHLLLTARTGVQIPGRDNFSE